MPANCQTFHAGNAVTGVMFSDGSWNVGTSVGSTMGYDAYTNSNRRSCKAGGGTFSRKGFK